MPATTAAIQQQIATIHRYDYVILLQTSISTYNINRVRSLLITLAEGLNKFLTTPSNRYPWKVPSTTTHRSLKPYSLDIGSWHTTLDYFLFNRKQRGQGKFLFNDNEDIPQFTKSDIVDEIKLTSYFDNYWNNTIQPSINQIDTNVFLSKLNDLENLYNKEYQEQEKIYELTADIVSCLQTVISIASNTYSLLQFNDLVLDSDLHKALLASTMGKEFLKSQDLDNIYHSYTFQSLIYKTSTKYKVQHNLQTLITIVIPIIQDPVMPLFSVSPIPFIINDDIFTINIHPFKLFQYNNKYFQLNNDSQCEYTDLYNLKCFHLQFSPIKNPCHMTFLESTVDLRKCTTVRINKPAPIHIGWNESLTIDIVDNSMHIHVNYNSEINYPYFPILYNVLPILPTVQHPVITDNTNITVYVSTILATIFILFIIIYRKRLYCFTCKTETTIETNSDTFYHYDSEIDFDSFPPITFQTNFSDTTYEIPGTPTPIHTITISPPLELPQSIDTTINNDSSPLQLAYDIPSLPITVAPATQQRYSTFTQDNEKHRPNSLYPNFAEYDLPNPHASYTSLCDHSYYLSMIPISQSDPNVNHSPINDTLSERASTPAYVTMTKN